MKFTNIDDGLNWIMQKRREHASFEEFKKEIIREIEDSIRQIEEGKGIPMEDIVAEMEAKYDTYLS